MTATRWAEIGEPVTASVVPHNGDPVKARYGTKEPFLAMFYDNEWCLCVVNDIFPHGAASFVLPRAPTHWAPL